MTKTQNTEKWTANKLSQVLIIVPLFYWHTSDNNSNDSRIHCLQLQFQRLLNHDNGYNALRLVLINWQALLI